MPDSPEIELVPVKNPHLRNVLGRTPKTPGSAEDDEAESACPTFGYLRGVRERAAMLEFRFRTGDVTAFPYSWLGPVRFDPSAGLLLKFTGDVVYLVLVRGSNLDTLLPDRPVNLTDRGVFRHRITWVREMDEDQVRRVPTGEPTVDRIEVVECETVEEVKGWLAANAPGFTNQK